MLVWAAEEVLVCVQWHTHHAEREPGHGASRHGPSSSLVREQSESYEPASTALSALRYTLCVLRWGTGRQAMLVRLLLGCICAVTVLICISIWLFAPEPPIFSCPPGCLLD